MNYFQPNLVNTSYSADSNNALLIEDRYKAKNNFKRLGNEDLCGNAIDQNVSIREAFEKTGALNPPVSMVPYIENSFGNKIELKNHQAIVDSVTGIPMSVMKKSYEIQDNEPICRIFEENSILTVSGIYVMKVNNENTLQTSDPKKDFQCLFGRIQLIESGNIPDSKDLFLKKVFF